MRKTPFVLSVAFLIVATQSAISAPLPNPVLYIIGAEYAVVSGQNIVRYKFDVMNKDAYPADMFAAAPSLPACGLNTNASRSWVDMYDQRGKRLNGFCALGSPSNLNGIWFAMSVDEVPPSWIYIEITDRQTNVKYRSNLAETTL